MDRSKRKKMGAHKQGKKTKNWDKRQNNNDRMDFKKQFDYTEQKCSNATIETTTLHQEIAIEDLWKKIWSVS